MSRVERPDPETGRGADASASVEAAASPVRAVPGEAPRAPEAGIALCLSGGGYRAMLFHLGALVRLNELAYLPRLDRVSSVSGGSITSGMLALRWPALTFSAGVATNLDEEVGAPLRALAGRTLDVAAGLRGIFLRGSVGDRLAGFYDRHLFDGKTLQDIAERPRFVFNATNLQSGVLWRFSKPYMWDYRVGRVDAPETRLAVAVAASSAFPPFLSPLTLELDHDAFAPGSGQDLQLREYTTRPVLSDGGVYDNLGLETAWKRYTTILVSDGGGQFAPSSRVRSNWLMQTRRVLSVIDGQVRALRKRQVVAGFETGAREGAYWSIWSEIDDYGLEDPLPAPDERAKALARTPTRLARLDTTRQQRLINWGYAICDAAMRKHVLTDAERAAAPPPAYPYAQAGI